MRVISINTDLSMRLKGEVSVKLLKGKKYLLTEAFAREFQGVYGSLVEIDISLGEVLKVILGNENSKAYSGQDLSGKSLFAYRSSGIGDLMAMILPLRLLKEKYPTSKIIVGSGVVYENFLQNDPIVDEYWIMPYPLDVVLNSDYFMEFQGLLDRPESTQENMYDLFIKEFGFKVEDLTFDQLIPKLFINKEVDSEIENLVNMVREKHNGKPICFIQLDTSAICRNYIPTYWYELIYKLALLEIPCLVVGEPFMSKTLIPQYSLADGKTSYDFAEHSITMNHFISIVNHSDFVISADTSALHIAGALRKPMVGIFGGVVPPKLRISHFSKAIGIQARIKCSPCFLHSSRPCRYSMDDRGYSPCMYLIGPNKVFEAVTKYILPLFGINIVQSSKVVERAKDEKRAVVTLAIGEQATKMLEVAEKSMRKYAEKIGADFIVIDKEEINVMFPNIEKFQMFKMLDVYDRILYLDVDMLIHPNTPDVFELVPPDALGAVPDTPDGTWGNINRFQDMVVIQQALGDIGWTSGYFNSGVMVLSKIHKSIFEHPEERSKIQTQFRDQTLVNYNFQKIYPKQTEFFRLEPRFNGMEITGYSSRGNSRYKKTEAYFMHFAFEGDKVEQMKIVAKELGLYDDKTIL